jgi:hypothetical protein
MAETQAAKWRSQPTPGPDFAKRLLALRAALDQVQPLADHRGNFTALLAMVNFEKALAAVIPDIAPYSGDDSVRAQGRHATAIRELIRDVAGAQGVDPDRCKRWTTEARALLREIEGQP